MWKYSVSYRLNSVGVYQVGFLICVTKLFKRFSKNNTETRAEDSTHFLQSQQFDSGAFVYTSYVLVPSTDLTRQLCNHEIWIFLFRRTRVQALGVPMGRVRGVADDVN